MVNAIIIGEIQFAGGASLPECALFESASDVYEWRLVKNVESK